MRIDWSTNPQSSHPYVGSRMDTKPVANLQQCTVSYNKRENSDINYITNFLLTWYYR